MSNAPAPRIPEWTVGDRHRKARKAAGISVTAMAESIGRTVRTITNYEADETTIPRLVSERYETLTGVPIEWLLYGVEPEYDPDGKVQVLYPVTLRYPDIQVPVAA